VCEPTAECRWRWRWLWSCDAGLADRGSVADGADLNVERHGNYDATTGRIVATASAVVVDAATGHQIGDTVTVVGTPANRFSPILQLTPDGERGYFTTYGPAGPLPEYVRVTVVDTTTGEKEWTRHRARHDAAVHERRHSRLAALFTINTTAMTGYHSRVLVMDLGIGKPLNTSAVWLSIRDLRQAKSIDVVSVSASGPSAVSSSGTSRKRGHGRGALRDTAAEGASPASLTKSTV
jgi:hypothetical protein